MTSSSLSKERIPRLTKILYGAGDFGFALTDTVIGVLFAIFLTDVVGLSAKLAAAAVFIGRSSDYINDPIIGLLSDRTRSRWGRRRPFLLFGFLPFALAFAALWQKPNFNSDLAFAVYYGFAYLLYDAAATFVYMPYFALTPELTLDYDERTSLTSYRMAFSILGGLIAFTVPLALIGPMTPENASRVGWVGLAFGLAAGFPLLLTFFGTRERPEFQGRKEPTLKASLKAAAQNKPFIFTMGIFLFTWGALEIIQQMLLFFLKYRLLMTDQSDIVAGTVFIVAFLTVPFWNWISRKTDKRKAYIVGMVFLCAVIMSLTVAKPEWGMAIVLTLAALAGVGVGAMHVVPWSMIPDAVEHDELTTGERHEGMFYSLVTLFRKVASSITLPTTLLVLDWAGYDGTLEVQSERTVRAIQAMIGPIPSVFLLIGIVFAIVYPIGREKHADIRKQIAEKRGEGS